MTRWATAFQSGNQNLTRDDISQGKNQKINFKTFENEFIRNKIVRFKKNQQVYKGIRYN